MPGVVARLMRNITSQTLVCILHNGVLSVPLFDKKTVEKTYDVKRERP